MRALVNADLAGAGSELLGRIGTTLTQRQRAKEELEGEKDICSNGSGSDQETNGREWMEGRNMEGRMEGMDGGKGGGFPKDETEMDK